MSETRSLTAEQLVQVRRVIEAAAVADGIPPLSDQTLLEALGELPGSTHLLSHDDGDIVGYGYLADSVGELVVHPAHRRRGHGRRLALAAIACAARQGGGLRLWAHGQLPGAVRLAQVLGFQSARELWQLRRPLSTAEAVLDEPKVAEGVRLRTFQPGIDESAWLAVNRRAFAGHPEQERWELPDVIARQNETWFDAEGFILAERVADRRLLGFHWTKIHHGGPNNGVGEVYVLGVDPEAHGLGLGKTLLIAGLRYLMNRGCTQAMLYLDADNRAAAGLYRKLGFTHANTDVQYVKSAD